MEQKELAHLAKNLWFETFPYGYSEVIQVMGSYRVRFFLQNTWTNNIKNNDPLSYSVAIEDDGSIRESNLFCLVKPPKNSMLAYGSAKKRKRTIKQANETKIRKRFENIKTWVNTLNLKD